MFQAEPELSIFVSDPAPLTLREYQDASIGELRANFRLPDVNAQVLALMVGAGKTVIATYLLRECWQKGRRGIFVVDRINLLDQTSAMLENYGVPHGVFHRQHPKWKPGERIQVATVQTLSRRGWPETDLVVIDECHCLFDSHKRHIERTKARVIGLSATPFTRGMGKVFQKVVNVTTGNKLTDEKFLVPFKVWAAAEPDMSGVKVKMGEWDEEEASKRAMPIVGNMVDEYEKHGDGGKAIVFGVNVAHCEELQRQALSRGIKAELYTYRTDDVARDYMLREFRKPDSEIRWLISVAALSRGFDVPDVTVIGMCRPLKSSFTEFVQVLGRGLRPSPGKSSATILDLAGNFLRHYPRLVEFMQEGVNELDDGKPKPKQEAVPKEKVPRKCQRCGFLPIGDHCPSCGFIPPPRASVTHAQGTLGEFDGSKVLKLDKIGKTNLYGELKYYARMHRYSEGWCAHQYRKFVGCWPRGVDGPPIPTTNETLAAIARERQQYSRRRQVESFARKRGELSLF